LLQIVLEPWLLIVGVLAVGQTPAAQHSIMTARDVAVAGIDHLEGRHLAQLAHRRGILLQAIDEILLNPGLHVGSQAADARALADDRYAIVDGRRVFGEQGGQASVAPWMTTHAALAMTSGHRAQEENAAEGNN